MTINNSQLGWPFSITEVAAAYEHDLWHGEKIDHSGWRQKTSRQLGLSLQEMSIDIYNYQLYTKYYLFQISQSISQIMANLKSFYFLLPIILLLMSTCNSSSTSYESPPLEDISSTHPIIFDSSVSNSTFHIVWASDDKGVNYWQGDIQSSLIPSDGMLLKSSNATDTGITSNNNYIHVFWIDEHINYLQSTDNGSTWKDFSWKLSKEQNYYESISVSSFEDTVHLLLGVRNKLFYLRGTDQGADWSKIEISPNSSIIDSAFTISPSGILYIVWANYDLSTGESTIYLQSSPDSGNNWGIQKEIASHLSRISQLTISATNENYLVSWLADGEVNFISNNQNPIQISKVKESWPEDGNQQTLDSTNCQNDIFCLVWIDKVRKKEDVWNRIPFYTFLNGGAVLWANNDVAFSSINNKANKQEYLTPEMSFAYEVHTQNHKTDTFVFWSGKEEVGKSIDEFLLPYQIFVAKLKEPTQ